jgi:hypothetical protein
MFFLLKKESEGQIKKQSRAKATVRNTSEKEVPLEWGDSIRHAMLAGLSRP